MGRNFAWQRRFGIFGVSASNVHAVMRYIRTQEAHHRRMTFEQEFIALLEKHGVAYDPRYVFGWTSCAAPTALLFFFGTVTHGDAVG